MSLAVLTGALAEAGSSVEWSRGESVTEGYLYARALRAKRMEMERGTGRPFGQAIIFVFLFVFSRRDGFCLDGTSRVAPLCAPAHPSGVRRAEV
jgi:hypothetical protein